MIIIVSPTCDHCDESNFSEEELNAHIESVHKNPTKGVVADHCLELKSVESEKEEDLFGRRNRLLIVIFIVIVNILVDS